MTIDDITTLIASDESRTLELKKTTGELKDGMHAACAFLNTDGGWLIFGIIICLIVSLSMMTAQKFKKKPFLQYFSSLELAYASK